MSDLEFLFNESNVLFISSFIEGKMHILNQVPDFKEKDSMYADLMEDFENSLSEDLKKKFDKLVKLDYKIDEYYFSLAYYLGRQQSGNRVYL